MLLRYGVLASAAAAVLVAQPGLERCAALKDLRIPDVAITAATPTPAGPEPQSGGTPSVALPAHCLVRGEIDRRAGVRRRPPFWIGFELRLPEEWQDRFLFQGGGGLDGAVRPALGPASGANRNPGLARGFAVASTDAGHQGESNDASFSRDQQARIDNAYRSIERVTAVAKTIVANYYGRPWKHAYFDGCSNGGRQALLSAQRFPTYFDGIVSGAPAYRVTHSAIGSAWETMVLTRIAPKDVQGNPILSRAFSDADLKLVGDAVLRECDEKDGLKDGMVFNIAACRFDPAVLTCKGPKTDACLSAEQVEALDQVFAGPRNSHGEAIYSDWPYDPGIASPGWRMLKLGTSQTSTPNSADVSLMLSALKGYFLTPFNPRFDVMKFDFDKDAQRVDETAALQDATWTELSTFSSRGGKIILYHGMADPFFSANDTARYYVKLLADNGGRAAMSWARLFLVPGMTHCAGGPAPDDFDALGASWPGWSRARPPTA